MATILISSDVKDDYVVTTLPNLLKQAGHISEVVHPLEQMVKLIRATCLACGGIDLGILVHSTIASSGQDSPYRVAKQIRDLRDSFAFGNAVKGKSLPLLVIGKDLITSLSAIEYDALSQLDWVSPYSLEPSNGLPQASLAVTDLSGQLGAEPAFRLQPLDEVLLTQSQLNWESTYRLGPPEGSPPASLVAIDPSAELSAYPLRPSDEVPQKRLSSAVNDLIFEWRTALLHELEYVGFAVIIAADGGLTVNPTFKKIKVEGEILAPDTNLDCLRDSGYLIVSSDVCRARRSYEELAHLIENSRVIAKAKKTKEEEVFQRFFSENPGVLFQQRFSQLWPKPRLLRPKDLSLLFAPDFVVKPALMPRIGSKWKVLDIKLPDVKLTTRRKFHPRFSADLLDALTQVYDYRRYFNRKDAARLLRERFGYQPRNPQLAVLIGRRRTPRETQILDDAFESTGMDRVEIITYDELLDAQSLRIETELEWLRRLK